MSHSSSDSCFVLVSYDIVSDRRRNRVCKELKNHGERVQYSVFEGLLTPVQVELMEKRLLPLINCEEDSLRMYRLCATCKSKVTIHGTGKLCEDEEVYVV